jgi:hypothetical protein
VSDKQLTSWPEAAVTIAGLIFMAFIAWLLVRIMMGHPV